MPDMKALAGAMAEVVREHVTPLREANDALQRRLEELERREPPHGEPGRDGKDGTSVDPETIRSMVAEAVAALPVPKDGSDGDPGRDGRNGTDADMDALRGHCESLVNALPKAQDGKDGKDGRDGLDGADGAPGRDGKSGEKGQDGRAGNDGVGLAGALIDRDGVLNLTLTNGEVRALGRVEGRDGKDGERGEAGFSLDDFGVRLKPDGRTVELSFSRGDTTFVRELALPTMIYRGAFADGQAYERGDTVTWGGSLWHCNGGAAAGEWAGATREKPGDGSKAWTLAAKRGRDGKDFAGLQSRDPGRVKV